MLSLQKTYRRGIQSIGMALFSGVYKKNFSWLHNTPLPADEIHATPIFQAWHEFGSSKKQWCHVDTTSRDYSPSDTQKMSEQDSSLILVTWNVDAFSELPESRISAIISHILSLTPTVDIVFLQEISRVALTYLLNDSRIRQSWFSSEADATNWEGQSFATITLLSKSRFGHAKELSGKAILGPVWRVKYPSRFGRDALCCDVFVHSVSTSSTIVSAPTCIRLVNVHLDSLPINPSYRPRQIAIIASILRSAGRGLVAGDFNPVLPEDETLVQDNQLVDAWVERHPKEPGFTWGVDGKQTFPPGRLDKVSMIGLQVQEIEVMHPELTTELKVKENFQAGENFASQQQKLDRDELVPWSDHSGLRCSFKLLEH